MFKAKPEDFKFKSMLGVVIPSRYTYYKTMNDKSKRLMQFFLYFISNIYVNKLTQSSIIHTKARGVWNILESPFLYEYQKFMKFYLLLIFNQENITYEENKLSPELIYFTNIYSKSNNPELNNLFLSNRFYAKYCTQIDFKTKKVESILILSKTNNIDLSKYFTCFRQFNI